MSIKMKPSDPAFWMLFDGITTTPTVYNANCYICRDSEFAQMGLPLCYACLVCGGHVAADDGVCDNGHYQPTCPHDELEIRQVYRLEVSQELLDQCKEV